MPRNARYAPAERLLALGLALAEARGGLTLDEMAEQLGVGRRTAERLRDALDRLLPGGLSAVPRADGTKAWRAPAGRASPFQAPSLDELAELRLSADRARRQGLALEAGHLDALAAKLEAGQPRERYRRVARDLTDLLEATGAVVRPGPREAIDPDVAAGLRDAVLANRVVRLVYRRRDTGALSYPVLHPYGFLGGARTYLVGLNPHPQVGEHRLYAIANIARLRPTGASFVRDPDFDLQAFAARSFGAFWDGEAFDVVWRFAPAVAEDALRFRFHPRQAVRRDADGGVTVSFRASGLTEMAWHLVTWGEHVTVVAPEALRARLRECLSRSAAALDPAPAASVTPPS